MFRGLYSATTSLDAGMQQLEVTSENMANLSMPGYRQKGLVLETFDRVLGRNLSPVGDLTGTSVVGTYTDFRTAGVQATGNPLDVALGGDSFFALTGPRGPVYSRNGGFRLDNNGQIVSESNYPLQGQNGPIVIPANTANIQIANDGTVSADGVIVDRIRQVRFANTAELTSVGPTLYRAAPGSGMQATEVTVSQGYREGSNANAAQAMVDLIRNSRYFDATQRALRTLSDSIALNTKPA